MLFSNGAGRDNAGGDINYARLGCLSFSVALLFPTVGFRFKQNSAFLHQKREGKPESKAFLENMMREDPGGPFAELFNHEDWNIANVKQFHLIHLIQGSLLFLIFGKNRLDEVLKNALQ